MWRGRDEPAKKHHCDHGEDHDAVLTHKHTRPKIHVHTQHLLQLNAMVASLRTMTGVLHKDGGVKKSHKGPEWRMWFV